MEDISIISVVAISFVSIAMVHQASRATIGISADTYPSGMLIAGGIFWLTTSSINVGIVALCSAAVGHCLSVYICKKYSLYQKED